MPNDVMQLFEAGIDRKIGEYINVIKENPLVLNLGAGNKTINGTKPFDFETGWLAPSRLPGIEDETVDGIFAFHFLEHLEPSDVIKMMKEVERVLKVGAAITFVVPYYSTMLAHQDLDHKTFFTEETFPNLFVNPYNQGTVIRDWSLRVQWQLIIGNKERNLCLIGQVVKK